jgi:diacylglycerol kinase (ATP)
MDRMIKAFFNSLRGLSWAARNESAVRQELLLLLMLALPLALLLARDLMTFALLIGSLLTLLAVELLNTAIEKLCDHVMPDHHPQIGLVKDLGSAAVFAMILVCALVWGAALWRFIVG